MRTLLLQGPVGPFFAELHQGLEARGWDVSRVCIDGGDLWTAGTGNSVRVWTGAQTWADWLAKEIASYAPDAIVLFGAERPAHKTARALADEKGIPVLCLEEGYRRPGYITAEWGGNNHRSRLRNLPLPEDGQVRDPAHIPQGMAPIITWTAITYTARVMFSLPGQWKLYHRKYVWPAEVARWARNLMRWAAGRHNDAAVLAKLAHAWDGLYDVFALQVPGDRALVEGGAGWTTDRFLTEGIASFARHAPADRRLVIKIHPMARGHADDAETARRLATLHRVEDRVAVVITGPLAPVLNHARGLATITSTSSLAAIERGLTTLVLGQGITRRADLALCGPHPSALDAFWTAAPVATPDRVTAFRRLMDAEALVPGDAYHPMGREMAVAGIVKRMESALGAPVVTAKDGERGNVTNGGYTALPEGHLEKLEGIEQLRFLENSMRVRAVEVTAQGQVFWESNNTTDIQRIESILA